MEIRIDIGELRKRKLMVATPMYGGVCNGQYAKAMCDMTGTFTKNGIELRSYFLFNESLITRARNYCVDEFMRSDCTHLLFIDSDIAFNPQDVIALLALQSDDSTYDVIGAPYPKKCITWEKIKQAVDKGVADENPNALEDYVGDFVFNPVLNVGESQREIRLDEPADVLEIGTGFMMIRRKTFEMFNNAFPDNSYKPDHVRTKHFDGTREIMMYFQAEIDPKSKRYLSEDYWFCQKIREIGGHVYICPWMHLQHAGYYNFGGKLSSLAAIGASATADPSLLKNTKK
jgi:glycosyltransferase involved in cell wall biosynthesis